MRERIKSVILLVLIVTSVFLTTKLLFGQPYWETASPPAYEQVTLGDLRPIQEQVLPVLRLGEDVSWLQLQPWDEGYQDAWEWLSWLFRPRQVPTTTELPNYTGLQVRITFPLPVQSNWWVTNRQLHNTEIRQAVWFAEVPEAIWYQAASGRWLRGELTLPDLWDFQLTELFASGQQLLLAAAEDLPIKPVAGGVLLPQTVPELAVHTMTAEKLDTEKMLSSFFVNLALVRRIEERDGAVIYTDGQKGLRLFSHGELEFTAPENEPGSNPLPLADILQQGAQYLQLMGGWPAHLYLQEVHTVEQSPARWEQRYTQEVILQSVQKGLPLVGAKPAVRLYFSDRGVVYYQRHLYVLGSPAGAAAPLVEPQQAITAVADKLAEPGEYRLVSVTPVLHAASNAKRQSLARPAWLVELQPQQSAIVDGFTGEFITWVE